jgi:hypothetical protein
MALTEVTFTNDLSGAIAFSGTVKIKCDDINEGQFVEIQEARVDGTYERAGGVDENWSVIAWPKRSRLFELRGDYKIKRSHSTISVGYEA